MKFLISTENTENEILLFPVFGSFRKIFLLKMKTEIQSNTCSSPFSISSENKNRKQPNQTPLSNFASISFFLYCNRLEVYFDEATIVPNPAFPIPINQTSV